jgi:hypothetical protein
VDTRRIPRAPAGVGDDRRNCDLARRFEQPRRANVNAEREWIRRLRYAAATDGGDRAYDEQQSAQSAIQIT